MTNTADMTPVQIDTELARLWADIDRKQDTITRIKRDLERRYTFGAKSGQLMYPVGSHLHEGLYTSLKTARIDLEDLQKEAQPFEAEFKARGGWHRYFLVKNGNGHVHRNMNCTTCFPTTQYAWLVDLADCNEVAMVRDWGERACTVCFPDAPTNPLYHRPAKVDREAAEAREAEKAAKQAAKDAKAIPPTKVEGETLRTKTAARNRLSEAFSDIVMGTTPEFVERKKNDIRILVPVLEAAGIDWKSTAIRSIKKTVKECQVPPNNPFGLTPVQVEDHTRLIANGAVEAQAFLKEVVEG